MTWREARWRAQWKSNAVPCLRVRKIGPGRWGWWVTPLPTLKQGAQKTHGEALAVGLAALEAASVGRQQVG